MLMMLESSIQHQRGSVINSYINPRDLQPARYSGICKSNYRGLRSLLEAPVSKYADILSAKKKTLLAAENIMLNRFPLYLSRGILLSL